MRIISLLIAILLFCSTAVSAQELPPLPSREGDISAKLWEDYSRNVLNILFPTRKELIKKLSIRVLPNELMEGAGSNFSEIFITAGLIRMVNNEHEYAAVLAHEFTHRMLLHLTPRRPAENLEEFESMGFYVFDRQIHQRNELEADFGGIITSFQPKAFLSILYRTITVAVEQTMALPAGVRATITSTLFVRMNSAENLIKINSTRIFPAGKLPGCLPGKKATAYEWEQCILKTFVAMYPNHQERFAVLSIILMPGLGDIRTITFKDGSKIMEVDPDFIRSVAHSPEELAVLLGHEFGHVLVSRDHGSDYRRPNLSEGPDELKRRKQMEADIIAVLPIERGECHLVKVLERMFKPDSSGKIEVDEARIGELRINRLRAMCALNY